MRGRGQLQHLDDGVAQQGGPAVGLVAVADHGERAAEQVGRAGLGHAAAADRLLQLRADVFDLANQGRPLLRALNRLGAPTRYCTGSHDEWRPRLTELLAESRPGCDAQLLAHALLAGVRIDLLDHPTEHSGLGVARARQGVLTPTRAVLTGEPAPAPAPAE
ncbi:hypothetical protein LX83_006524 [Goodfellowiella coeruleoviolacea]|uniref:Uncharacterized protein n=1 Tax=Goodfellowiella coeruleoviolacea TaxID=334858 RepID=A0AAE3GL52_9PSEU|nr:hypothetical protein [Goodfellowiella coeruleoviolacea]